MTKAIIQGIVPQNWKQDDGGRYLTQETIIDSPWELLKQTLAPHQIEGKDTQDTFAKISFHQTIPLEVGERVRHEFSVAFPSNEECHIVEVKEDEIAIYALSKRGLFYGAISLTQMLQDGFMPYGIAYDEPVCEERGLKVFLPSRENIPFFKEFVDTLSFFKYNTIMIEVGGAMAYTKHPEINQEWIKYCADMSEYSGKTKEIQDFTYPWYKNAIHMENGGGNFLTQEEVKDLVTYCKEREFNVIPEVPSLGHCDYLLLGHPEIAEIPEDPYPDTYCPSKPLSYEILFDVLDDIIAVFEPSIVNIGHDEFYTMARCDKCKGKSGADIFAQDTIKIYNYLKERQVKCMIWGDKILKNAYVHDAGPFGGAEIIMYTPAFKKDTGTPVGVMPATWQAIDMLPKDIEISHWLWSLGEELENEVLEKGYKIRYGNFEGYLFPNWEKHIPSSRGAIISNWSSLNDVILQRNVIYFGLAYAYEMFWNHHYSDKHFEAIRDKTLSYLFYYRYPALQRLERHLDRSAHPKWIEINYATDYSVKYEWFVDGVFPEEKVYKIGQIRLSYSDGTQDLRPIVFGENIGKHNVSWDRERLENPQRGEPIYKVDEQLYEVSLRTLPNQKNGKTFYAFPIQNPHPEKELVDVTVEVLEDKSCQVFVDEIAYYN